MSESELEKKVAKIEVMALDVGHYGMTYCSNCNYDLEKYVRESRSEEKLVCPGCDYDLVFGKFEAYPFGGSDF